MTDSSYSSLFSRDLSQRQWQVDSQYILGIFQEFLNSAEMQSVGDLVDLYLEGKLTSHDASLADFRQTALSFEHQCLNDPDRSLAGLELETMTWLAYRMLYSFDARRRLPFDWSEAEMPQRRQIIKASIECSTMVALVQYCSEWLFVLSNKLGPGYSADELEELAELKVILLSSLQPITWKNRWLKSIARMIIADVDRRILIVSHSVR